MTAEDLLADGWRHDPDDGFLQLVGPLWVKHADDAVSYGILTEKKHRNRRGVVQGGLLATLADRSLGRTARFGQPDQAQATVQLDVQYIDAANIGDFISSRCSVQRRTRTLIFVSGQLEAEGRLVASMMGIFKVLEKQPD